MLKFIYNNLIPTKTIQLLKDKLGVPSQQNSFKNLNRLGFRPKFCLDIGAYEGTWTKEFKQIFPACAVLMIEGQTLKEPALINTEKDYTDVDHRIALLGASAAEVTFNIYETASSVLTEHYDTNAKTETRKLVCLDTLIDGYKLKQPDFIKIDTQGYELEILKGGLKTLKEVEFVLLEVSFLDIYVNCPLVIDIINFMSQNGFVVYDICSLMKRPLDKALFQSDFIFAKEVSRFRNNKHWI